MKLSTIVGLGRNAVATPVAACAFGVAVALAAGSLPAHAGSSASFASNPESLNGGAGPAGSANFTSRHILGQGHITGLAASATFGVKAGYLYMGPGGVLAGAPTNPARLVNISTRMQVLTGNDVMIGGFVVGGATAKRVAIVATGPSLVPFGIPNALANPTLTLVRSSDQAVIATNDDWQAATNAADITAAGFAPTNPLESAILVDLPAGAYTAIVQGVSNTTGVSVIGVYEVSGASIPLVNISTRGRVLTGNDVMIGGFVIGGDGPKTVAIVATGPSLAPFGIASPLANPTITLVRQSDQTILATNDDWQSDASAGQLQAAGFAPTNILESGLYRTLPPGAYTVIVEGVGGAVGVAVIGVYAVQ
jgi:hypothetical protein